MRRPSLMKESHKPQEMLGSDAGLLFNLGRRIALSVQFLPTSFVGVGVDFTFVLLLSQLFQFMEGIFYDGMVFLTKASSPTPGYRPTPNFRHLPWHN